MAKECHIAYDEVKCDKCGMAGHCSKMCRIPKERAAKMMEVIY
jgi:hypothetical protein